MGAHFPTVEFDNAIRFSTLFRMSRFLWYSSRWARRFGCFFQYKPGLEVLASSLDTDRNYVTPTLQLHHSLNNKVKLWQLLGGRCGNFRGAFSDRYILTDRYVTPAVLSPGLRPTAEFSGKMDNFLRSLTDFLLALAFLCCLICYLPFALILCAFIVSIILATFESIISQSRCSLEPKSLLWGLCPLKSLLRVSEHLPPEPPASLTLAALASPLMFTPGSCLSFIWT